MTRKLKKKNGKIERNIKVHTFNKGKLGKQKPVYLKY